MGWRASGRLADARAIFECVGHPKGSSRSGQLTPPEARGFSWAHALEADALFARATPTAARALADSILRVGKAELLRPRQAAAPPCARHAVTSRKAGSPTPSESCAPPSGPRTLDANEHRAGARAVCAAALCRRDHIAARRGSRRSTPWDATCHTARSIGGWLARSRPRANPTARTCTPRTCATRGATPTRRSEHGSTRYRRDSGGSTTAGKLAPLVRVAARRMTAASRSYASRHAERTSGVHRGPSASPIAHSSAAPTSS